MNRKVLIVSLTVAIAIVITGAGIYKYFANQKKYPQSKIMPEMPRFVKSAVVSYDTIATSVVEKGRVVPVKIVELVAEGSGKIEVENSFFEVGQKFKKGDQLFTIYQDEVLLALKARKSSLQKMVANILPDIKLDYEANYEDFFQFFNSINLDSNLPDFPIVSSNQLKLFLASNGLMAEYYSILKDEKAAARYSVYAPFDGSFSQVYLDAGTFAPLGSKIAQIIESDQVFIEIPVDVENARFISIGDKVALRNEKSWGKVYSKADFVDENTQSQLVYVLYKNTNDHQLLPGEYIETKFYGQSLNTVMEIPRNAVFNFNEVFLIKDGRLMLGEINVIKQNSQTLLFNGLNEGDSLVVQPIIGITNGSKVKPLNNKQ